MRVAVLGGGFQACCIALVLADRGARVVLFERQNALLQGAASNNEGKIHLGYVYGGDPSLKTARLMVQGALAFAPFVYEFLGQRVALNLSTPFFYVIHRDSQKAPDYYASYLAASHAQVTAAADGRVRDYFGLDLFRPHRLSEVELEGRFDTARVSAAFRTPEIAVDPVPLCGAIRAQLAAHPNIELHLDQTVAEVVDQGSRYLVMLGPTKSPTTVLCHDQTFDHVFNAMWDGRLKVDAKRGLLPPRPWLHRLKYGFRFRSPDMTVSTTIVLGPFGDTVAYESGWRYISWYPACMKATSTALLPPPAQPLSAVDFQAMRDASFDALAAIMPALGRVQPAHVGKAQVCGGMITAQARTDIDDPDSELHARSNIGITSIGNYHSVDPGKFTMAPYFARLCADRVLPRPGA